MSGLSELIPSTAEVKEKNMSLKIFHTADLHLGMKFAGYGELQDRLAEARFKALERLVAQANAEHCHLLVVAGDLFERVTIGRTVIRQCAEIMNEFEGHLVAVLPGNHDYFADESDLWTYFKDQAGDRVLLLEEERPYSLAHYELDATLYPAPCTARYSGGDGLEWIRHATKSEEVAHHIGVAHGNLEGCGWDDRDRYYPMTWSELDAGNLDLWLLGHIHVPFPRDEPDGEQVFYAGVPEPDGFDCAHEGSAWIIELDGESQMRAISVKTGMHRFVHDEIEIHSEADLERVMEKYSGDMHGNTLLKLKLKGRIPREVHARLQELRETLENRLCHLQMDTEVAIEITRGVIDREFTQDSFPHRLLNELGQREEDFEALQIAYEMIQEVRE